jgi:hypothetical protein
MRCSPRIHLPGSASSFEPTSRARARGPAPSQSSSRGAATPHFSSRRFRSTYTSPSVPQGGPEYRGHARPVPSRMCLSGSRLRMLSPRREGPRSASRIDSARGARGRALSNWDALSNRPSWCSFGHLRWTPDPLRLVHRPTGYGHSTPLGSLRSLLNASAALPHRSPTLGEQRSGLQDRWAAKGRRRVRFPSASAIGEAL